jgi:uncharacterized Tic20 family protein
MKNAPTADEKMMAALVHASVLLSFLGGIVPALIWSFQRRKSEYVRFHALQAMGYQTLFFWFWFLAVFGIMFLALCLMVPVTVFMMDRSSNPEMVPFLIQPVIFVGVFSVFGLYFLIGFIGAIFCFLGREFRYPLLGRWLERYLVSGAESAAEISDTREDDWVAGLCHATAIMQMWGMILPIVVWVTQKEGSLRLRFQAVQSAVYQGAAFLAYLLGMMVYAALFLGMFFVLFLGAAVNNGREISGPFGVLLFIIFLVLMMFGIVVSLLWPLYLLLALIGMVSVIRGKDFRYPLLGRFIENRMKLNSS